MYMPHNVIYLFIYFQLQESLAPRRADPQGYWQQCKMNHVNCNAGQIHVLQGITQGSYPDLI